MTSNLLTLLGQLQTIGNLDDEALSQVPADSPGCVMELAGGRPVIINGLTREEVRSIGEAFMAGPVQLVVTHGGPAAQPSSEVTVCPCGNEHPAASWSGGFVAGAGRCSTCATEAQPVADQTVPAQCIYLVETGEFRNGAELVERHDQMPRAGSDFEVVYKQPETPTIAQAPSDTQILALVGDHNSSFIAAVRTALARWGSAAPQAAQSARLAITDPEIDAVAERMPGGPGGFLKQWGYRQFARDILALSPAPTWEPSFDCMVPEQEALTLQFCEEIAGLKGQSGRVPDPVRLLEMAEDLYNAERKAVKSLGETARDASLWCVNVHGSDDVHAMPTRLAALERANEFNEVFGRHKFEEGDPIMRAVVIEWPRSAEAHAVAMRLQAEAAKGREGRKQ